MPHHPRFSGPGLSLPTPDPPPVSSLLTSLLAFLVTGCSSAPAPPPLACDLLPIPPGAAVTPADTLDLRIHLDSLATAGGRLLVRVDSLGQGGAFRFDTPPPPTAAVAAVTLAPDAPFKGCFDPSPAGFRFRARAAPRRKVWVRVAADRPVRTTLETGSPGQAAAQAAAALLVVPGASARTSWPAPDPLP
ncbi:MAG TPA: hypothetical protein VE173_01685 [Longimicrobiales bacterium]|nr:hypothetical protein [Longimicrobiales bacterium]